MRTTIDLDEFWRFLPDLDPQYHENADYAQAGWDRRHWETVRVPARWNLYGERYALYEGVAWFARTFHLQDWPETRMGVLRFGGVNYEARIYVNGQLAGEHRGGYTEFTLDVSGLLRPGENLLVLRVDDRRHRVLLPACFGWFNYGGIHRGVTLELTDGARIDWVGVDAVPVAGGAEGHVRVRVLQRDSSELHCRAAIVDPEGGEVWSGEAVVSGSAAETTLAFHLPAAAPWSPARPALHRADLILTDGGGKIVDRVSVSFGVRQVRAEGPVLLLNGEPLQLNGICYLEDHPAAGIAYDPAVARQDLDDIQELGVNALRCHVPLHEDMLAECDRRGLLVLSEVPIYCLDPVEPSGSAFADPAFIELAVRMEQEMVLAAYNHPSVIMWSLGNECKVAHPEAAAFFRTVATAVRDIDTTRLLIYASLYGDVGPVADFVDVIGINEYWGWYDRVDASPGRDRPLLQEETREEDGSRTLTIASLDLSRLERELCDKAARYDKPLLLTEFGADAVPGYRSRDLQLWSEDYQAYLLERTLAVAAGSGNVCGTFPFLYQDYPDPSKYTSTYWAGLNLKGVVTYDRVHKAGYAALRAVYRVK